MNRWDLKDYAVEKMEHHIAEGQRNAVALAADGDFIGALERATDRMDLVYAVWPENDPRKPRLAGYGLALLKGIPYLEAHHIAKANAVEARVMNVEFESHKAACEACRLVGDDQKPLP